MVNSALACLLNKAPQSGCTKPAIAFSQVKYPWKLVLVFNFSLQKRENNQVLGDD